MTNPVETALALKYCCQVEDMNRDWGCRRTSTTYMLQSEAREIASEAGRVGRMRNPRRKANLTRWIEEATARLQDHLAYLDDAPCAKGNPDALTRDEMMPACTC